MTYTITRNEAFNSLEITFDGKPAESIRAALKALRFRWHGVKKLWYGYADEAAARAAIENAAGPVEILNAAQPVEPAKVATPANRFGVKVGDLFEASWGYEQTNVDFFQVVALVGKESVRVRQVLPRMVDEVATCSMAADRVYQVPQDGELLPPAHSSVFIHDQEKGDLKRLKSYDADGVSHPQFRISSYADAHYCAGPTVKAYESWYY